MDTATRTLLAQVADEAYGFGCATEDPFYVGVIALADYLRDGTVTDDRLVEVLEHVRHAEQVCTDPRDPRNQKVAGTVPAAV